MTPAELLESRYRVACGFHPLELQLFWDLAQKHLPKGASEKSSKPPRSRKARKKQSRTM